MKIRLARAGTKKRPFYRVVVAEVTAPRDGRFVEKVGTYDPRLPADHMSRIVLKSERIKHWVSVGAQPTERVAILMSRAELAPAPEQPNRPKKSAPRKKAVERVAEKEAKMAEKSAAEAEKKAQAEVEASKPETEASSKDEAPKQAEKAEGA